MYELKIAPTTSGLNSDTHGAGNTRDAPSSSTDLAPERISVAREQALMRYGIDPIVIETSQCPQRAACHLDFDPGMLDGLNENTITQSWHRGMAHAVIARDVRTSAQLAGLVQVLRYGQSEVEEFEFTTRTATLDLSSLANALSQCTALRHLAIKTADMFRFELFDAIKMLPILRSLKLEAPSFENLDDGLAKKFAELRCLSIKAKSGGESLLNVLPQIAQYCASLTDLRLACGGSKQAGLAIASAIKAFHCLQSVTVEGAGDEAAAQIAKAASETASVTRLSFPGSTMTEVGSERLMASLKTYHRLEMLLLAAPIGDKAAQVLGGILQAKVCRLRELELRGCDLTEPGIGSIAMGLRSCSSLASFALQSNTITERSAFVLCSALGSYGNLVKIQTTGGNMLSDVTHMFAFVVNQSHTLLDLDLRGNSLREDGAKWFANALEQNRTLLRLEINRNQVSAETTAKIDDALLKNFQRMML